MLGAIEESGSELRHWEGPSDGEALGSGLGVADVDGGCGSGGEAGPLAGVSLAYLADAGGHDVRGKYNSRSNPRLWVRSASGWAPGIKCAGCKKPFEYADVSYHGSRCYVCCVVSGYITSSSHIRQLGRRLDRAMRLQKLKLNPPPWVPYGRSYTNEGRVRSDFHAAFMSAVRCFDDGPLLELVGYTPADFKRHIERQFLPGMTWRNWGRGFRSDRGWHVDHIIAKSRFLVEELPIAYRLSNLRPLWEGDNMRKGPRRTHLL